MQVRVRYFAALRERKGVDEEWVPIQPGDTALTLYQRLFPPGPLGALPVTFARNLVHVPADTALAPDDELVFLPPIGGG